MDWQLPDIGKTIPCGVRFKRLFQPNQPSMETTMQNYNNPEKTHALPEVVQT